jgi:hypothetical protein
MSHLGHATLEVAGSNPKEGKIFKKELKKTGF